MEFEYAPHATPSRGLELRHDSRRSGNAAPTVETQKKEIFYGWVMIPLATLVMICSAPGQTYGFMRFNPSIRESLSLSQTDLSATYLLATLCAAWVRGRGACGVGWSGSGAVGSREYWGSVGKGARE